MESSFGVLAVVLRRYVQGHHAGLFGSSADNRSICKLLDLLFTRDGKQSVLLRLCLGGCVEFTRHFVLT